LTRARNISIVGRRAAGESFTVDTSTAELVRDSTRRNAYTLLLDGVESSHVDLDEPTYLLFEYVRWFGDIVDCLASASSPLDAVHLGGGAATFARYIATVRPGSWQVVFELDAALVALVREKLPLPKTRRLRIRVADARLGLASLPADSADVVVRDAFLGTVVPPHLRTVEFAWQVREILRPAGVYLVNVADGVPFRLLGPELAALHDVFGNLAVVSEPAVFRGRRHGNVVIAASNAELPLDAIARRVAAGAVQGRVRRDGETRALARGHRALRDTDVAGG
jgi:hypothetical protein